MGGCCCWPHHCTQPDKLPTLLSPLQHATTVAGSQDEGLIAWAWYPPGTATHWVPVVSHVGRG
jgi:hypothetical protein